MSRIIASEFVGHQLPGLTSLALKQTAEEPFSRTLIATTLHENVHGIPILINRTPEILPLPLNGDEHFVDVPDIAQAALSFFKLMSIGRYKLLAPLANCFVGDRDATVGKQFFDLSEPEAEPMVQLDGVTDDLRWKTKTLVAGPVGVHHTNLATPGYLDHTMRREEIG